MMAQNKAHKPLDVLLSRLSLSDSHGGEMCSSDKNSGVRVRNFSLNVQSICF